jgi:biotin-(acetyl-CoA carboxylase) ligase
MWLRHAPSHGEEVRVALGDKAVRGVFRDIDGDGALVVERKGRTSRVALADALDRMPGMAA